MISRPQSSLFSELMATSGVYPETPFVVLRAHPALDRHPERQVSPVQLPRLVAESALAVAR